MKKHISYKINNKNGWDVYARGIKTSVTIETAPIMFHLGTCYAIFDEGKLLVKYNSTSEVENFLTGYLDQELRHGS